MHDPQPLCEHGWLSSRSAAFQRDLLALAIPRSFPAGASIYTYGDPAVGLFGVISGAVEIEIPADDSQLYVVHQAGRGFWVGDLAMLANKTRLVSVRAMKETHTVMIPSNRVVELVTAKVAYWQDFYALTHENMETALRVAANMGVARNDLRLALRLLHLLEKAPSNDGWLILSHEKLAALSAVSVPTAQRTLTRLSDLGLIELRYGRIRVVDRDALLAHFDP